MAWSKFLRTICIELRIFFTVIDCVADCVLDDCRQSLLLPDEELFPAQALVVQQLIKEAVSFAKLAAVEVMF